MQLSKYDKHEPVTVLRTLTQKYGCQGQPMMTTQSNTDQPLLACSVAPSGNENSLKIHLHTNVLNRDDIQYNKINDQLCVLTEECALALVSNTQLVRRCSQV